MSHQISHTLPASSGSRVLINFAPICCFTFDFSTITIFLQPAIICFVFLFIPRFPVFCLFPVMFRFFVVLWIFRFPARQASLRFCVFVFVHVPLSTYFSAFVFSCQFVVCPFSSNFQWARCCRIFASLSGVPLMSRLPSFSLFSRVPVEALRQSCWIEYVLFCSVSRFRRSR